jgi:DNA ligase 4
MGSDYGHASQTPVIDVAAREREFDAQYPNRPRNHKSTLPFHSLFDDLFNPLLSNKKPPSKAPGRRRLGPDHGPSLGTHEKRRAIIERYMSQWRQKVGPDFFPSMRLILPEKDRDRAMYGIKERALGKYLVKIMKIDKDSDDARKLQNWKVPGTSAEGAGDFANRCFQVLQKRPFRTEVGDMTVQDVNDALDELSAAQKEEHQLPLVTRLYQKMNAEELLWVIRIILRQMKVGATEKTFLEIFHPDADALFNISSSLRRVCWQLYDVNIRLETEHRGVTLMQCYQPQLAGHNNHNFQKTVDALRGFATEDDNEFWIEEKLDGERMQLHMRRAPSESHPDNIEFRFFSRKAKDYTYLYGRSQYDDESALTRHLRGAFNEGVENMVLDGEMITWNPEQDRQAAFGTLKTAALSEKENPFTMNERPLLRVFDVLLLNDKDLTQYTLRERRKALDHAIKPVHRRLELHPHEIGIEANDIDPHLRKIVETASEGLVLKNPRSRYSLNDRNRDWIKVKPEYMQDYGESLDCLVIGGYYGSGKRGGILSSFLCGLRADEKSHRFLSFFKVGGGMTADDYAMIEHITDGKWNDWDVKKPPVEFVTLAGPVHAPKERPDRWIKPEDSFVVEVKAASVGSSDEFATKLTLRFPRFKKLRKDRDWENSLTVNAFLNLKAGIEKDHEEKKKFKAEEGRKNKRKATKKTLRVMGSYDTSNADVKFDDKAVVSDVFRGLTFWVVTESTGPEMYDKKQLETLIKRYGGSIVQTHRLPDKKEVLCIVDRRTVKAASLQKTNEALLIRPKWLFDCIAQARVDIAHGMGERVLLFEPERHLFYTPSEDLEQGLYEGNADPFGDAYYRDTGADELKETFSRMDQNQTGSASKLPANEVDRLINTKLIEQDAGDGVPNIKGWMFRGMVMYFPEAESLIPSLPQILARSAALFHGARDAASLSETDLTHVIIGLDNPSLPGQEVASASAKFLAQIQRQLAQQYSETGRPLPYVVTPAWITESLEYGTILDEERFVPQR